MGCTVRNVGPFSFELLGSPVVQAGPVSLHFQIRGSGSAAVENLNPDQLLEVYEKKLHAYVFDDSLTEFQHLHPSYDSEEDSWELDFEVGRDGDYQVWVEGLARGVDQSEVVLVSAGFTVSGGESAWAVSDSLPEALTGGDTDLSVSLVPAAPLVAGNSTQVEVLVSRNDGGVPQIGTYLGTKFHVTGARLGGGTLVHSHGISWEEGGRSRTILEMFFSEAGDYRVWVQFSESDQLRLVPLAVSVGNKGDD
jgi:hypothetical protein